MNQQNEMEHSVLEGGNALADTLHRVPLSFRVFNPGFVSVADGKDCFIPARGNVQELSIIHILYINLSLKISFDCALAAKLTASIIHKDKKYNFIISKKIYLLKHLLSTVLSFFLENNQP